MYAFNWRVTSEQRGLGDDAFKELKVEASNGSDDSYDKRSIYITSKNVGYYNGTAPGFKIIATANGSYNCLAYALGNTHSREWFWDHNPTITECIKELKFRRYETCSPNEASIIAYGDSKTNVVTHFAKKVGTNSIEAKWGNLEVVANNSLNPYIDNEYGKALIYFKFK